MDWRCISPPHSDLVLSVAKSFLARGITDHHEIEHRLRLRHWEEESICSVLLQIDLATGKIPQTRNFNRLVRNNSLWRPDASGADSWGNKDCESGYRGGAEAPRTHDRSKPRILSGWLGWIAWASFIAVVIYLGVRFHWADACAYNWNGLPDNCTAPASDQ